MGLFQANVYESYFTLFKTTISSTLQSIKKLYDRMNLLPTKFEKSILISYFSMHLNYITSVICLCVCLVRVCTCVCAIIRLIFEK